MNELGSKFGIDQANDLLKRIFAPWIVDLGLSATGFDGHGGTFLLPANPRLVHVGGVVCGQATASAADTVSVVTHAAMNGRFRICTTRPPSLKLTSSISRLDCVRSERPSALITPAVTVCWNPYGLPIAIAT